MERGKDRAELLAMLGVRELEVACVRGKVRVERFADDAERQIALELRRLPMKNDVAAFFGPGTQFREEPGLADSRLAFNR